MDTPTPDTSTALETIGRLTDFLCAAEAGKPATAKSLAEAVEAARLLASATLFSGDVEAKQLLLGLEDLQRRRRSPSKTRALGLRKILLKLRSACETQAPAAPPNVCCRFTRGGKDFFITLEDMLAIAQTTDITPLPLSPPYIRGLIHTRGSVIAVVDTQRLDQEASSPASPAPQMVIARAGEEQLAFLCDGMPGLSPRFKGRRIDPLDFCRQYAVTAKD